MGIRTLLVVFLAVLLSGCATTRKVPSNQAQQLHNRINDLEVELQQKEREINSLEGELKQVQGSSGRQKIEKSAALQLSVRQIQIALKSSGFYKGPIDGKTGPQTKEAVKAFQRANGLKADGIIGKLTSDKLRKYLP